MHNKTLIQLIDMYQQYSKDHKEAETVRYQESHARSWRRFLKKNDILDPEKLNEKKIVDYIRFAKNTCKNITINKRLLFIKQVYSHFEISNKDLFRCPKLRETRLSYEILHENELKLILKHIKTFDNLVPYELTKKLIVMLLLDTGVRQSELLNIEIKNINFHENSIYLTRTKTRLARTVFFTSMTKELLQQYVENYPIRKYLLWNYISYSRFTYRHLEWLMKKLKDDLGLKKLNARMFRHTMATALAENGCDIYIIQKILGHSNIKTTETYLHMSLKKSKIDYQKYNLVDHI